MEYGERNDAARTTDTENEWDENREMNTSRNGINISLNSIILILSVFYSIIDIFIQWKKFSKCYRPIQLWLVVSFISILLFRFSHFFLQYLSNTDEMNFIIYRRRNSNPPYYASFIVICILYPFFTIWNIIGTVWIYKVMKYTPHCVPNNIHPWFIVLWIILCYIWILLYLFFIVISIYLEYQSSLFEREYNALYSNDIVARWGNNIELMRNYGIYIFKKGLSLKQIQNLPYYHIKQITDQTKCSICLNDFIIDECVRTLILCGHTFHKNCIDLWLIRNASCPNCKSPIATEGVFNNV